MADRFVAVPEEQWLAIKQYLATAQANIAQVAVLPKLVSQEQIGAASGQSELIFNLSAVAGPPVAGLLLAGGHLAVPFIIDSVSFGVLALAVRMIRSDLDPGRPVGGARWRDEILAGFRTLARYKTLRALSIMTLVGDFLFSGITVLMTVLIKSRGASPSIIGAVLPSRQWAASSAH